MSLNLVKIKLTFIKFKGVYYSTNFKLCFNVILDDVKVLGFIIYPQICVILNWSQLTEGLYVIKLKAGNI